MTDDGRKKCRTAKSVFKSLLAVSLKIILSLG
jgi:hypothetical protein